MAVVQVDVVDAESSQALLARFPDIFRFIANFSRAIGLAIEGEFRGKEDLEGC
jgi:hypothetical protein